MPDNVSPYIEIVEFAQSPTGKTKVWHVLNKRDASDIPGVIKWYGGWRGYVYDCGPSFYDAKCLRQIADFIDAANKDHRAK